MNTSGECPDCGATIGQPHRNDCDVERCSVCGGQRIACDCSSHDLLKSVWAGRWPVSKNKQLSLSVSKDKRIGMRPRQCFYNAWKTMMHCPEFSDAAYVEGVAVIGGLPLDHGWLEKDGEIIDPTLPEVSLVYFPGLILDGQREVAETMKLPRPDGCDDLPLLNRFGWGGHESAEFCQAREGASRLILINSERLSNSQ